MLNFEQQLYPIVAPKLKEDKANVGNSLLDLQLFFCLIERIKQAVLYCAAYFNTHF